MFHPRAILMVLITIRLLMPPGICVCKLNSPAARFLVALLKSEKQVPNEEERDDDHAPGCPASPLATGMGVIPPAVSLLPPDLSLDALPPLESPPAIFSTWDDTPSHRQFDHPQDPLYLTLRALLI